MPISLSKAQVDAAAPNADAIKNGEALVRKGQLAALSRDASDTLLFGQCAGSGKEPYRPSADFADPGAPVYRCSCPSRQFPCKHVLALLYAHAAGQPFAVAEVPADLAAKRAKNEARTEKKQTEATAPPPASPKRASTAALAKKLRAQLAGLDLLDTVVRDLTRAGLANFNAKTARAVEDQAKQLGDAYLPGAQVALRALSMQAAAKQDALALGQLVRLHALGRRGREFLEKRLADPALPPDTGSSIAEGLGHAWQIAELRAAGLARTDVELVQLAFHCHEDPARHEFVDRGLWLDLTTGDLGETRHYRPFKAVKHLRADDTVFGAVRVPELVTYPHGGDLNPRIRWETTTATRPLAPGDFDAVRRHARPALAEVLKAVKNGLRQPLASRRPAALVRYGAIGTVGEGNVLALEDPAGGRIALADAAPFATDPGSCHLLTLLRPETLRDGVALLRFWWEPEANVLRAQPLSLVTGAEIIRLTY